MKLKSIKLITASILIVITLSGCAELEAWRQENHRSYNEYHCNQGSNCWNALTTDQKLQLISIKQQQRQHEESLIQQRILQNQANDMEFERQRLEFERQRLDSLNRSRTTNCQTDNYGNTRCTSY